MGKLLFIALGGAIGTLLRYSVSGFVHKYTTSIFPWGTLWVNVLGCFLAGFLWELFDRSVLSPDIRVFVFIGLLGGFTTFSSFSLESFNLFRDGEVGLALMNVLATNILCMGCIYGGFVSSRYLISLFR